MLFGWLVVGFPGCSTPIDCRDPDTVIATSPNQEQLVCAQALQAEEYVELLAGRPMQHGDRPLALRAVQQRFESAPTETLAWLEDLRRTGAELASRTGFDAAEARATRVWRADRGEDLITPADETLWGIQKRALAVWAKDDAQQLAITESDLEAWIRYASLCREVQGGGVLRISVADRVTVYRELIERFDEVDRGGEIALASMGPIWQKVRDRWQSASYDTQQEWISEAPLPPPMTATSLGYAEEIFRSDVSKHAEILQRVLGPFPVGDPERFAPPAP